MKAEGGIHTGRHRWAEIEDRNYTGKKQNEGGPFGVRAGKETTDPIQ